MNTNKNEVALVVTIDTNLVQEVLERVLLDVKVLRDVLDERRRQDAQWGGPEHDDEHVASDWLTYIRHQADHAKVQARVDNPAGYRERLVKIAALAVAAIESHDRLEAEDQT